MVRVLKFGHTPKVINMGTTAQTEKSLTNKGGVTVLEWLVRLFNICFMLSIVPVDWVIACMVPIYKGKGDMYECSNFRGISLLSVVGKVYGRVLIGLGIKQKM